MGVDIKHQIQKRTKGIGLHVIRLIDEFPQKQVSWVLAKQVLRSSTAIGSNYRAACRAKSTADFINKLKIVEEETDETIYWLEVIEEPELATKTRLSDLMRESSEILAIVVASRKTSRSRQY